jgi:hypothetical protein
MLNLSLTLIIGDIGSKVESRPKYYLSRSPVKWQKLDNDYISVIEISYNLIL